MTADDLRRILRKHGCKPSVVARILKMNPDGAPVGKPLRGWYRKSSLWVDDMIGPRRFIADHGIAAYRATDPRWWRWRGCKKAMKRADYLDNAWRLNPES